jgi:hypothetical protein
MRVGLTLLLPCACLLLGARPASAILIDTGGKRVGGYLVSEDVKGKRLTVRVVLPDGEEKVQVFELAKITVRHKVDRDRLAKLTKENPGAYVKYAEELADKKTDPEAIEVALRLFLIAAYLEPAKMGRACLLRMSELAADDAHARKYRAMAFLLDANHDPALLKLDARKSALSALPDAKAARAALTFFRKALQQFREGKFKEAQQNAGVPAVAVCFKQAPGMMDQKSFIQACKDATLNKSVAEGHLEYVLRAEIWALRQILADDPMPMKKIGAGGWYSALHNHELSPIPPLSLETITQYNPRECVFRKGSWKVP